VAAGVATAAGALGAQWAAHLAYRAWPFAPYSVADAVIRRTPGPVADWAIERLGHADKPVLVWSVIAGALMIGAVLGRRSAAVKAGGALLLTLAAAAVDPRRPSWVRAAAAAGVAALAAAALSVLLEASGRRPAPVDPTRRRLLAGAVLAAGAAWLVPAALRRGWRHSPAGAVRADHPVVVRAAPAFDEVAGLSPLVTPAADHYTVDIDLEAPAPDDSWRLAVRGRVADPRRFSLADLRHSVSDERVITLSCISNQVGGPLVGNARWTGVPLADLLRASRPTGDARFVVAHGADGYWETYPLDEATSGDGPLVAVGMDGLLLPAHHGFPARLVVPGHYGMKSVKWLTGLDVVADDPVGYWGQRGWTEPALTRTESRIDTPVAFARVRSPVSVAGVAWAGTQRVSAVEVSCDDGRTWLPARLEQEAGPLSWRRWRAALVLPPGVHPLTVRAVDGSGARQDPVRRPPHPGGASGYHRVAITVLP
jgi:sulfite oxidase